MLQSFVRIYDTSSLSVFKNTSPVLQFWCHNLQTFIDGQIRCHHLVSLGRYASRKMKPYAAYILQGVHGSRVLIIILPWPPLVWATIFVVTMIKELKTLHTGTRVSDDHYFETLLSRAKFNHLLLFNISYQLPHIWMILMALMSRPLRLNRPNFKRSENRGHLRPFNSHFQMLKCVIIQFVLLFDKVLAFVNIPAKYKYYIVR